MPKWLKILLILAALCGVGYAVFATVKMKGGNFDSIGSIGSKEVEQIEVVQISVVRYQGKVVSHRLIIDGTGRLSSRHHITKESVGVAFYEEDKTIKDIQSRDLARYIISEKGFTHEVVKTEVRLE